MQEKKRHIAVLSHFYVALNHIFYRIITMAFLFFVIVLSASAQSSVLTQHNDNARTGENTSETILNTSNVNANQFGKLFAMPVDGQVYAQPLYVHGVTINGGVHNVMIIATEADSVYAYDADSASSLLLWKASMVDAAHGAGAGEKALNSATTTGCDDMPQVGITSTPVIDPIAKTIYVEAKSTNGTNYFHRLHALDLLTGNEKSPGPVVIAGTVSGTGDGSANGQIAFDNLHQLNRPGLLLLNSTIYIAYASHCDKSPYHGWLFAYDAATFTKRSVYVTTPNGGMGGFWMSGAGVAADTSGNIFIVSGNGDFVTAKEMGDAILKLGTTNQIPALLDYFTPFDQNTLNGSDLDLGSGGVLLLPDQPGSFPHILVEAGKEGRIYVVNRDQMTTGNSHYCSGCTNDPEIIKESGSGAIGGLFNLPAYWNSTLYFWGASDVLKSIPITNGLPDFTHVTGSTPSIGFPGAGISISSNGTNAETAILWALNSTQHDSGPAILYAYDATNISSMLYSSTQNATRDAAGTAVKFTVPTISNGKVYVGTSTAVDVYGLLPFISSLSSASGSVGSPLTITGANFGSSGTVTFNGTVAAVTSWSATNIATSVPSGAITGNVVVTVNGAASNGMPFTVNSGGSGQCPCTIWPSTATPGTPDVNQNLPVELGVRFTSSSSGFITGVRFFKGVNNTSTHVGNLWSSSGTLLARATFTGESSSGWQQVNFSSPVAITANTVYVASYFSPTGDFAVDRNYFNAAVNNPPLQALQSGASSLNGLYNYGSSSAFPAGSYQASNYWVDVVFNGSSGASPLTITTTSLPGGTQSVAYNQALTATGGKQPYSWMLVSGSSLPAGLTLSTGGVISGTPTGSGPTSFSVQVTDSSSPVQAVKATLSIAIAGSDPPATCPCRIWPSTATPGTPDVNQSLPVELGVRFTSGSSGFITGVRFFKGVNNTGTHVGNLWSSSGTLLARATFTGESSSGWQQVNFSSPVAITANTVYVASYFSPTGDFAVDRNYFNAAVNNPPLQALQDGGVYNYGSSSAFPAGTFQGSNYWVDVVFNTSSCPCRIWPSTATPGTPDVNQSLPVELGVRFTSSSSGFITGVRFFKGVNNTGTHVGNLWSSSGTLLARATFTGESSSGWQQVNFSSPVAITANTVYVASYFSPTGDFAVDRNYFNAAVNNPPLQALQDGGVYNYGSSSAFPAGTFQGSNYWVDVVFNH